MEPILWPATLQDMGYSWNGGLNCGLHEDRGLPEESITSSVSMLALPQRGTEDICISCDLAMACQLPEGKDLCRLAHAEGQPKSYPSHSQRIGLTKRLARHRCSLLIRWAASGQPLARHRRMADIS